MKVKHIAGGTNKFRAELDELYKEGWRVIFYSEDAEEYSAILEREDDKK